MHMNFTSIRSRIIASVLVGCMAAPALAQQSNQNSQDRQQRSNRQQRSAGQQDNRDDSQRRNQRQNDRNRQSNLRVQPEGWVSMAVDYDNDGAFDGVETIYVYDLQRAQQRSRQRQNQMQSDRRSRQNQGQSTRSRQSRGAQVHRIDGTVQDLRKITMHDGDGRYVIARVETDEGRRARVLLGSEDQLSQLNLQSGDDVQIQGRPGRINDRWVLVATQVRSGDQQVRVTLKRMNRPIRHYKLNVLRTRTAQFRNHDEKFLVAEARTERGQRVTVNLGPKSKFDDLGFSLSQASNITMLARPGRINGERALIAEQVSANDQTIKITPNQRRDRRWSGQNRNRSNRDGNNNRNRNRDNSRDRNNNG